MVFTVCVQTDRLLQHRLCFKYFLLDHRKSSDFATRGVSIQHKQRKLPHFVVNTHFDCVSIFVHSGGGGGGGVVVVVVRCVNCVCVGFAVQGGGRHHAPGELGLKEPLPPGP